MTRRTFFLASFWILLLAVLVLIWQLATVHSQRDYLQKSVDERFVSHFSLLCDSLFSQDPVDTGTARASAQVCTSLFPLSSYGADESLQNILLSLKQMVPPDQIYLPVSVRRHRRTAPAHGGHGPDRCGVGRPVGQSQNSPGGIGASLLPCQNLL